MHRFVRLPPAEIETLWRRAAHGAARHYRICNRRLCLRCDSEAYAQAFRNSFRHMQAECPLPGAPFREIVYLSEGGGWQGRPTLVDRQNGAARVFDADHVEPSQLFFALAFAEGQMFPLDEHLILHAAVVQQGDEVTAIVGRTRSGKSTLGLRMALAPGVDFLSDEFAPVRIADGFVEPFPRRLGLRRATCERFADQPALAELAAGRLSEGTDQFSVEPCEIRGLNIGTGGALRNLVLISGEANSDGACDGGANDGGANNGGAGSDERLLEMATVPSELLAELGAMEGVTQAEACRRRVGWGELVRLRVLPGAAVVEKAVAVCKRHGNEIVNVLPANASRPDFADGPRLKRLAAMPGLLELARSVVNGKALEARYGAGFVRILDLLAQATGKARVFSLRPGPLEATFRLLQAEVLAP